MMKRMNFFDFKYLTMAAAGVFFLLLFTLCAIIITHSSAIHADYDMTEQKAECYISIQVHPGDSLWEISRRYYSSEYKNLKQYMNKIMDINHISSEGQINAGTYLIIPYYD